jgi:hypothetical protein
MPMKIIILFKKDSTVSSFQGRGGMEKNKDEEIGLMVFTYLKEIEQ